MRTPELEELVAAGRAAGLTAAGVASCAPSRYGARLDAWLSRGAHADMTWMANTASVRKALLSKWAWARSALVGALSYLAEPLERAAAPGLARHVARYARGADYHTTLKARLSEWGDAVERLAGVPVRRVALVDTSAVLERELAQRAGLGWIGKNSCLIGPSGDSWRVLGVLLTDLPLPDALQAEAGAPLHERCGTCRACLDACPTGAITEPWFVDARRCISYWTIEHRGLLPAADHAALGEWLFGCDVCQEVCPWNRRAAPSAPAEFNIDPRLARLTLADLLRRDETRLREALRGTPLTRPKRGGLLRNALIVAANVDDADALREAARLADDDPDPLVRATARAVLKRD